MKLFETVQLGNLQLKNRMAMAPMTRSRADLNGVVGDLTVLYYTQRATAGLIISEAINISKQALGSPFTPGIHSREQIEAWKKVTQAVHDKGAVIYAQLWHTGRVGHSIDRGGELPVAPSAIAIEGAQHFTSQGLKPYETPRELTVPEIRQIVLDYAQAARNAMEAGFDGVELHAANGYLPNQFLAESANLRTDEYGGNIENNSRFVLEVMQALVAAIGPDKAGIRISPTQPYGGIATKDPLATFGYLIGALNKMPLSYVHLMRKSPMFPLLPGYPEDIVETFSKQIQHTVIANGSYDKESGEAALQSGVADLISYGVLFLANPDLPRRFELNAVLNEPDMATMFGGGEKGYTDYAFL
ncbi:alkene reductase [Flavihumibacter stibioxidans]|uniref:Alkene reductase n=1 Tax=Flavihumibacter stibioxidans TaxID=1834163 RepID=A0ABR7M9I3_9BACT|nr:alkene reductase [Flavihumibacter stibioxidans]MBC6491286.1 alkene reductase [Flavihumibacter stibioxidans]